jgi:UDP-glucose 4-epimerase
MWDSDMWDEEGIAISLLKGEIVLPCRGNRIPPICVVENGQNGITAGIFWALTCRMMRRCYSGVWLIEDKQKTTMAKFLITGAAGFIGSALARALVCAGHEVCALDDLSSGTLQNFADIKERVDFRHASVLDLTAVSLACKGVECVFHEAAVASVTQSVDDPLRTNSVNLQGTLNVLFAARNAGVKRVIYAASSAAYGTSEVVPKREDMRPAPGSPYAVQKLAGEHYMKTFSDLYGLETVCLRYFNVFGPRQDCNSPYSGVLARFINQMLKGQTPTIYGDGDQTRDFVYIDDVVEANLLASAASPNISGQVFNIGTGRPTSLIEAYNSLAEIIGFSQAPKMLPARLGDVRDSLADITLARKALGYSPATTLKKGLSRTVEWYREQIEHGIAGFRSQYTTSLEPHGIQSHKIIPEPGIT